MHAILIIVLILAILLVIFTLQNSFEVTISVFFWEISNAPLVLVLIICVVLGYIIAAIYFYPHIWKLKKDYRKAVKSVRKLEEKLQTVQPDNQEKAGPDGIELDENSEEEDRSFFKE